MTVQHATLMDGVYRYQRYIYDATRKYYLLGRDRLIADLDPPAGGRVLEVGVGTGRNLILAARRYPGVAFHGLDISSAMLETAAAKIARAGLSDRITLAQGDATAFTPAETFGVEGFDRVFFSYTLSMVPDWSAALDRALAATASDGTLHVVDFGQQEDLPRSFRWILGRWLALFHVAPQADLRDAFEAQAIAAGRSPAFTSRYRDYCWALSAGPAGSHGQSQSPQTA